MCAPPRPIYSASDAHLPGAGPGRGHALVDSAIALWQVFIGDPKAENQMGTYFYMARMRFKNPPSAQWQLPGALCTGPHTSGDMLLDMCNGFRKKCIKESAIAHRGADRKRRSSQAADPFSQRPSALLFADQEKHIDPITVKEVSPSCRASLAVSPCAQGAPYLDTALQLLSRA